MKRKIGERTYPHLFAKQHTWHTMPVLLVFMGIISVFIFSAANIK